MRDKDRLHDGPRIGDVERDGPIFAVSPVPSRARVPRAALLAITIGVMAFVAGIGVASTGPTPAGTFDVAPRGAEGASPTGDSPARPAVVASGSVADGLPASDPGAPGISTRESLPRGGDDRERAPGSSAFLGMFDPAGLIRSVDGGGERCRIGEALEKQVPRTRRDGPRLTFQRTWMAWCPIEAEARQAFMLGVFDRLVDAVPADTFGFSATLAGAADALLPYREAPLAGTVAVTAGAAGRGLAIAVVASEWRTDSTP